MKSLCSFSFGWSLFISQLETHGKMNKGMAGSSNSSDVPLSLLPLLPGSSLLWCHNPPLLEAGFFWTSRQRTRHTWLILELGQEKNVPLSSSVIGDVINHHCHCGQPPLLPSESWPLQDNREAQSSRYI